MKVDETGSHARFSIGADCISCGACWRLVPEHFESHVLHAHAIITRQPATATEVDRCEEALRICPVGVISRDSAGAGAAGDEVA